MARGKRLAGEGGVYRWREYWAMDVEMARGADGKRKRKKLYAKTTAELLEKRRAFDREQHAGLSLTLDTLTLAQLLTTWLESGVKIKNSAHTYESSYEPIVRLHLTPWLGKYKVKKLNTAQGQAMINALHEQGYAPRTLRNIRAVLRKALNQAKIWYGLDKNIAENIEIPRATRPKRAMLNQEQAQRFLDVVAGHRLEPLFWTAILMGLRLGELIGLKVSAINLEAGTMRINMQIQRVEGKLQEVPTKSDSDVDLVIPSILVPIIEAQLARLDEERSWLGWQEHGLLFPSEKGTPLEQSNVWRTFKALLKKSDLPDMRIHDLRHTCASLMISRGVHLSVVKERLRHSQISVTADIYGHVFEETQRAAAESIGGMFVAPEAVPLELPKRRKKIEA
jgi:integrase